MTSYLGHFLISTLLLNYGEIVRGENKQKNPQNFVGLHEVLQRKHYIDEMLTDF